MNTDISFTLALHVYILSKSKAEDQEEKLFPALEK